MAFCDGTSVWVAEWRAVDVVYLEFSKGFETVSCNIVIGKLRRVRWTESWVNGRARRAVISSAESGWRPVTSGDCQGSVVGPVFFNFFTNELDKGT